MSNQPGILVSFEGMEGAGKSTQCELLIKKLKKSGKAPVMLREPGGVPVSEQIRDVVLNPKNKEIAVTTEVLLFQAARAQLYAQVVLPSIQEGKVVVMDRTRDSSLVYQGMVRGIGVEWIEKLSDYSTQNTTPNVTFLLDVPVKEALERISNSRKLDRIEQEGLEFHEQVRQAYLDVAKSDKSGRWVIIDGTQPIEKIEKEIWEKVESFL